MSVLNPLFSAFLVLSAYGSAMILFLLVLGRLLKGRFGWRWLYYLWLVAVFRLLLPLSLGNFSFPGNRFLDIVRDNQLPSRLHAAETADPLLPEFLPGSVPQEGNHSVAQLPFWGVWAVGAGAAFGKRSWDYQRFLRHLRKRWMPVKDPHMLERFQNLKTHAGIRGKTGIYICPNLPTPILIGLFRPCVVLPSLSLPESALDLTILHELSHCRRKDAFYKQLVQVCLCIHWFNPLVYWMEKEINRLCELACDESVLESLPPPQRAAYGDMLVNSLVSPNTVSIPRYSLALKREDNLHFLKERLGEIMKTKRRTKAIRLLSVSIACLIACTASVMGVQAWEILKNAAGSTGELWFSENLFAALNPVPITLTPESDAPDAAQLNAKTENLPSGYIWPVGGTAWSVSAEYQEGCHSGLDIAAEKGTPVYAVADGTVTTAEFDTRRGKYIVLLHNDGTESYYCHCNELLVSAGQKVLQGDKIAEVGMTGFATGPHLHIEFQVNGEAKDSKNFLY